MYSILWGLYNIGGAHRVEWGVSGTQKFCIVFCVDPSKPELRENAKLAQMAVSATPATAPKDRRAPKPAKAATNKRQCAVDDNHEDATSSSSRDPKMCVLHALHGGRSCLPRQETQETISQPITSRTADHKSYSRTVERFNPEQCAPCTTRSTSQISTPNPSRLRTDPHDNNNQPQTNPRKYSRILQVQGHQKIVL